MSDAKTVDCLIVGGGLAGLSMGYRLSRSPGITYAILEKGEIGQSWIDMHDSLRLLSPMWVNRLPGHRFSLLRSFAKIPKDDFVWHLQSYAAKYAMRLVPHTEVKSVCKESEQFAVETSSGRYAAKALVNATGFFCYPWTPPFQANDGSIKIIHSAQYKSPERLHEMGVRRGDSILIIGKRVSAGQLLEELHDAGFKLGISVQAGIETRAGGVFGFVKENLYYTREILRHFGDPYAKQNSLALMNGGKTDRIIRSGKLEIHPPIASIRSGVVQFRDGHSRQYDLVIAATGFRPVFRHLANVLDESTPLLEQLIQGEHRHTQGLFFLGVDNLVNFKSRYVRGIAADSQLVYDRIRSYLDKQST